MELSIVTTLYQSAPHLEEFYTRLCAAAETITRDYEVIFVNDGSPDDSLEIVISLYEENSKVRIIDLSRNFGHHKAMMTGLAHARGDLVFLIDCDLEVEPETLFDFYRVYENTHVDVVYGLQERRHGRIADRIAGRLFYTIHNSLSTTKLPSNLTTARLMSRRYVSALVSHHEREVLIAGLWAITGFDQMPITVTKRSKKRSSYTMRHKVSILVDSVTSFSTRPLILMFYAGCMVALLSGIAVLALIIRWTFFGRFQAGWPSLIASMWLLGGFIILCLGLLGIYLAKVLSETKQRPYTIIRKIYRKEE